MGKFMGAKIAENRQYENLSDPANSNYMVILGVTVPEAVIDPETGKTLKSTLAENDAAITAAATAATEAQTAAQTAQSAVQSVSSASTPTAFSVDVASWTALASPIVGRGYSAEIAAEGVTAGDYPDIYFDIASIEAASAASILADTADGTIVLYAKSIPKTSLSGTYFIKKGDAV